MTQKGSLIATLVVQAVILASIVTDSEPWAFGSAGNLELIQETDRD